MPLCHFKFECKKQPETPDEQPGGFQYLARTQTCYALRYNCLRVGSIATESYLSMKKFYLLNTV